MRVSVAFDVLAPSLTGASIAAAQPQGSEVEAVSGAQASDESLRRMRAEDRLMVVTFIVAFLAALTFSWRYAVL